MIPSKVNAASTVKSVERRENGMTVVRNAYSGQYKFFKHSESNVYAVTPSKKNSAADSQNCKQDNGNK